MNRPSSNVAPLAAILLLVAPGTALADDFATPPGEDRVAVAGPSDWFDDDGFRTFPQPERSSLVRFLVGPAAKLDSDSAAPGLLVATDIGRGPAGLRLTGAWMNVGTDHGISQYTGELTLDFGGRSQLRPVVGAGGGLARTSSSVDATGNLQPDDGSNVGIGVVRAGLGLRLPFDEADARVQLDVTGAFPAIRSEDTPDIGPWVMTSLTVAVGF